MTFTHRNLNDTFLERDGDTIVFSFIADMFTMEENDHMELRMTQDELFRKVADYIEAGQNADIFDQLTCLGLDALWNALYWMHESHIEL